MIRSRRARPPTSARSIADRCSCHRQQARPFCAGGRRAARPNTVPPRLARLRVRFSFARPSTHRSPSPPRIGAQALRASEARPSTRHCPGPTMMRPHLFRLATSAVSRRDKCGCKPQQVRFRTMTGANAIVLGAGRLRRDRSPPWGRRAARSAVGRAGPRLCRNEGRRVDRGEALADRPRLGRRASRSGGAADRDERQKAGGFA